MHLQTFDNEIIEELGNLELLSLSNNEFDNIIGFNFLNLIEVFNFYLVKYEF